MRLSSSFTERFSDRVLEAAPIGWQLFVRSSSLHDQSASLTTFETFATRLLAQALSYTAAREQAFSVKGVYAIEDRVFNEVGLRRPKEAPFDLLVRVFILVVLLLLSVLLGLLALLTALAAASAENMMLEGSGFYIDMTVDTYWDAIIFFAVPAIIFF